MFESLAFIIFIILVGGFFGKWQERWTDQRIRDELDRRERRKQHFGGE